MRSRPSPAAPLELRFPLGVARSPSGAARPSAAVGQKARPKAANGSAAGRHMWTRERLL